MNHLHTAYKLGAHHAKLAFDPNQMLGGPLPLQTTPWPQQQSPQLGVAGVNPATLRQFAGSNTPGTATGGPSTAMGQRPSIGKNTSFGPGKGIASLGQPDMNIGAAPGSNPWTSGGTNR